MNGVQSLVFVRKLNLSVTSQEGGCSWGHALGKLTQVSLD